MALFRVQGYIFNRMVNRAINNWRASEASETLSGVYKFELVRYVYLYWRASEASETLSGVTQSRFPIFIGERAKRARHS